MDINSQNLVHLRDRIGLMPDHEAKDVLQRLTWTIPHEWIMIDRAIDDVCEHYRIERLAR